MESKYMKLTPSFFNDIRKLLQSARQKTYMAINFAMVDAYWHIGKRIVEEEQNGKERAEYGEGLLKILSQELSAEFGKGFSEANLRNFRQFFLAFSDSEIGNALRSELTWTHYRLIMRVENRKARDYYINETAEQNWSTRELERNINSFSYERILSSKNSKVEVQKTKNAVSNLSADFIKDPYVFEFLNIPQDYSYNEKELESALVENLQKFLLELGKGFSFIGRQFRISTETSHFYIDLVFYNYILKCFVLIDLKTTKLTHQDIGQMDMYVRMFDNLKKQDDDNPTIGIILCSNKDETTVKYSVLNGSEQLFASKYKLYLPTEEELIAEVEREKLLIKETIAKYNAK